MRRPKPLRKFLPVGQFIPFEPAEVYFHLLHSFSAGFGPGFDDDVEFYFVSGFINLLAGCGVFQSDLGTDLKTYTCQQDENE
jgi:hypothetical protein